MKYLISTIFLIFLVGCKQEGNLVVISGDSWGFFVCTNKSLEDALKAAAVENASVNNTCAVTTRIGLRAENWRDSVAHKATVLALKDKAVRVLYLSLGGNDVLNHWKKSMSVEQSQLLFDKIKGDIGSIVEEYRALRPDIKILISGYDFPRFTDNHPIKEYREAFEDMESPTPKELNAAVLQFSDNLSTIGNQESVFYIQHYGLMHYHLGNAEQGLLPLTTLAPEHISPPDQPHQTGGNPDFQSDTEAMLSVGGIVDAFHLNKFGYRMIADHAVLTYLKNWLQ